MSQHTTNESVTLAERFFINTLDTRQPVSMYLVNGFQLKGEVVAFDEETILFKHKDVHQLIMRAAVASMYPLPGSKGDSGEWWRSYVTLPPLNQLRKSRKSPG